MNVRGTVSAPTYCSVHASFKAVWHSSSPAHKSWESNTHPWSHHIHLCTGVYKGASQISEGVTPCFVCLISCPFISLIFITSTVSYTHTPSFVCVRYLQWSCTVITPRVCRVWWEHRVSNTPHERYVNKRDLINGQGRALIYLHRNRNNLQMKDEETVTYV